MPLFTSGGLGLGLKNLVMFTSLQNVSSVPSYYVVVADNDFCSQTCNTVLSTHEHGTQYSRRRLDDWTTLLTVWEAACRLTTVDELLALIKSSEHVPPVIRIHQSSSSSSSSVPTYQVPHIQYRKINGFNLQPIFRVSSTRLYLLGVGEGHEDLVLYLFIVCIVFLFFFSVICVYCVILLYAAIWRIK